MGRGVRAAQQSQGREKVQKAGSRADPREPHFDLLTGTY